MLDRHDEPDLGIREPQLFADQRQQYIKSCSVPMRQAVTGGDQPYFFEAAGCSTCCGHCAHDEFRAWVDDGLDDNS
jgi:hypothetical protein